MEQYLWSGFVVRLCYSDSALLSQRRACHFFIFAIDDFCVSLIASPTDGADRLSSSIMTKLLKAPQRIGRGMLGVVPL